MPPLRLVGSWRKEVEDQFFEEYQIVGGMLRAQAHLVIGKGDIHTP